MKRGTAFALASGGFVAVVVVASVLGGTARAHRWTRAAVRAAAAVVPDAARRGDAKAGAAAAWPRAKGGKGFALARVAPGGRRAPRGRRAEAPSRIAPPRAILSPRRA